MQCKSAEATRDELAEALAEGQGNSSLDYVKDTDPHYLRNNAARQCYHNPRS